MRIGPWRVRWWWGNVALPEATIRRLVDLQRQTPEMQKAIPPAVHAWLKHRKARGARVYSVAEDQYYRTWAYGPIIIERRA